MQEAEDEVRRPAAVEGIWTEPEVREISEDEDRVQRAGAVVSEDTTTQLVGDVGKAVDAVLAAYEDSCSGEV
jgi:hypothetical protein